MRLMKDLSQNCVWQHEAACKMDLLVEEYHICAKFGIERIPWYYGRAVYQAGPHVLCSHSLPQGKKHTLSVYYRQKCILPPLLADWLGSFMCRLGNTGVEQVPNKSQHKELILEKKILCRF